MRPRYGLDDVGPINLWSAPTRISLGESLTVLSVLYVCSISAFNAGYFSRIPGHFTELFTFSDLIGTNIQILQYFISAFSIFCTFSFFGGLLLATLDINISATAERVALRYHINSFLFLVAFLVLWFVVMAMFAFLDYFKITTFTILVLPEFIFQGVLIFYFWVGYKYNQGSFRSVLVPVLIGLVMFSTASGRAWLKSEIAGTDGIQSLFLQDGVCIDRKILRASSNGFLLYNPGMEEFEFRSKDTIKTIFQRRSCS
ncbi:hypothetical protein [Bradyrhizobium sp. LM6.9]